MKIIDARRRLLATSKHAVPLGAIAWLFVGSASAANLVVNPANTNANDRGEGSESQPLLTIGAAMKRLRPGDHVFIAEGVYREPVLFPSRSWDGSRETVIEGDPNGHTLIKGSVVMTAWRSEGGGRFVAPIGYEPEQVFVDGEPLRQIGGTVFGGFPDLPTHPLAPLFAGAPGGIWPGRIAGGRASMPVNSFHYDKLQGDLMIRTAADSLDGRRVEVGALQRLVSASGVARVVLKNLSFEHSNTTATTRGGAVQMEGKNIRIENIKIRRTDGTCLGLNGTNHEIKTSSFSECGQLGMGGRGSGWEIADVTVSRNNTRGFNKWWEAGGAKFVGEGGLTNSTISRFKAIENFGDGLWFDYRNRDNRITNSLFAFNAGFGLHLEVCESFLVDHNVALGNRQRGIYLRQTSLSTIAFNLVASNGLDGVAIIAEGPGDSTGNNWVVGNVMAWNQVGLTLPEPLGDNRSDGNAYVGDAAATSVRIGWAKAVSRADWTEKGLDSNSEWLDLSKALRPGTDAAQLRDELPGWYRTMRSSLRALPAPLMHSLKNRASALQNRTDSRPGPP
ncbi:MAG TPA: right-handed parallel beta-helix repeat-containing protein [Burkholderiales bacterium]|nr:right-handed parallel beta-helix repeat-containing protein [Burkholderiales bacterium]